MKKETLILFLRILLGAVFIFSGIAKLDSIYQFEQDIFKAGVTNWNIIPYLSRFTIAAEIFLGICFFHKEGLKKFTIPATFIMLVVFTIHLIYSVIISGGGLTGNCGCFGQKLSMTPLESLIKNIIMMGALVFMYKTKTEEPAREGYYIPGSLGILSVVLVVMFFPVKPYVTGTGATIGEVAAAPADSMSRDTEKSGEADSSGKNDHNTSSPQSTPGTEPEEINLHPEVMQAVVKKADPKTSGSGTVAVTNVKTEPKEEGPKLLPKATSPYAPFKTWSDGSNLDLDEGIRVVTMYNSGCDHCMENAKKMCELNKKTKLPAWRILFWGTESEIPAFFEYSKCSTPYKFLTPQVFFPLLGKGNFPKVILLNNGNVVGEWEGDDAVEKFEESWKKMKSGN